MLTDFQNSTKDRMTHSNISIAVKRRGKNEENHRKKEVINSVISFDKF